MDVKLLITEGDADALALMRREAGEMGVTLLVADNGHEMIDLAKREHPALIIMDIKELTGGQKSFILEELQRSLVTREIPLLLTHTSPDIAWEEKYRILGVRELLKKPLDGTLFRQTVARLLHEGRGPMCFSERFARSFAAYNRTDMLAEQMIAKAMIAGRIHRYEEADLVKVKSALAILSVPVLYQNLNEVLSLCANALLSHDILQLIDESQKPTDRNAALVYAVVQLTQKVEGGKPLYIPPVSQYDSAVFSTVRALFESGLIQIRTEEDIHLVWKEISEKILEAKEYSLKEVSDFLESSLESIKTILFKRQEVYLRLCDQDSVPQVEAFFAREEGDNPCGGISSKTDAVEITYHGSNPETILERTGTAYARLSICLKEKAIPQNTPATEAPTELFDTIGMLTASPASEEIITEKIVTISAQEFMRATQVDSEDLDTLEELEGEITRAVERDEDEIGLFDKIRGIVGRFRKYATTIMYISEFTKMVDGLLELSGTLEGMESEMLDGKRQQLVLALLERLADDLYQWRKAVFIEQSTEDIHFMDDSIIASCQQVQSFLPKNVAQEETDYAAVTLF